jgi:hypothetical protein
MNFEQMKKFELIVGFIAILGIFLKILHIPGGSILTVLAFSTLSMFYYVFSFALFNGISLRNIFKKVSYKDTNAKRIIGAIGLGWALSAILTGVLFKLLFWSGANIQLRGGLYAIGLILPIATIFYFRNKTDYYKRIFKRIAIYGGLGLILYLMPSSTLVDIYYRNNPEYAELYKKVLTDPYNLELREQLNQMKQEMQGTIISYPEFKDENENNR